MQHIQPLLTGTIRSAADERVPRGLMLMLQQYGPALSFPQLIHPLKMDRGCSARTSACLRPLGAWKDALGR